MDERRERTRAVQEQARELRDKADVLEKRLESCKRQLARRDTEIERLREDVVELEMRLGRGRAKRSGGHPKWENVGDGGVCGVEADGKRMRSQMEHAWKLLGLVACRAFKLTMLMGIPVSLLMGAWYRSVEVGVFIFITFLIIWGCVTLVVTIQKV